MAEFRRWAAFYRAWPFDDRHRYHRPAALVAAGVRGVKDTGLALQGNLDWLQPPPEVAEFSDVDMSVLHAFGIRPPGAR